MSGSGKSSLIEDVLYNSLARTLHRASTTPGQHDAIRGVEQINKVIRVDQQPLGKTPTSNPATYTGVFDLIRTLFAQLPEARRARLHAAAVQLQRARRALRSVRRERPDCASRCTSCPTCGSSATRAAAGATTPRRWPCTYHGQSIADVLDMSCGKAVKLFENIPKIRRILQTLCDVGLDYLTLGQAAPTLSGGEAQRVKLAAELSRPDTGRTLYLLDEPTTGLHFDDIAKLLDVLNRLVDLGNTRRRDRAQPGRDQDGRLGDRHGPRGRRRRRLRGGQRHAGGHRRATRRRRRRKQRKPRTASGQSGKPSRVRTRSARHTGEVLGEAVLGRRPAREAQVLRLRRRRSGAQGRPRHRRGRQGSRACRGKPTAAAGTRTIAWAARASPAAGTARFWRRSSIAFTSSGKFSDTNWNTPHRGRNRFARRKTEGWFMHAITGEEWLLKLKFRVAKNTFKRETLVGAAGAQAAQRHARPAGLRHTSRA